MITGALLTIVAFLLVLLKLSPNTRKKILGYDLFFDILVTAGLIVMFGGTGTVSGMMISIVTGLLFSIALYVAKSIGKYQRLERITHPEGTNAFKRFIKTRWHWQEYNGQWRMAFTRAYNNMAGNGKPSIEGELA